MLLSVLLSDGHLARGLPLPRIAGLLSGAPAARFGLAGRGTIAVGQSADFALVDTAAPERILAKEELLHRNPELSPYLGRRFHGRVVRTLLRGRAIAADGVLTGPPQGILIRPLS